MQSGVLSSIAASDPRQVPAATFHLAVQAHTNISASLEEKRNKQQQDVVLDSFNSGGMLAFTEDRDMSRAATVLSAVQLVPVSSSSAVSSPKLGQKRVRSDNSDEEGNGGVNTNQLYGYDVTALHNITFGTVRTVSSSQGREILRAPIPLAMLEKTSSSTWCGGGGEADGSSSSSRSRVARKWKFSATLQSRKGDLRHTFVVPKGLVNSRLLDEYRLWNENPHSLSHIATLYEFVFGLPLHEAPLLSAVQAERILTPALYNPLLKTEAGRMSLSLMSTPFEEAYGRIGGRAENGENTSGDDASRAAAPPLRNRSTGDLSKSELGTACRKRRLNVAKFLATLT